MKRPPKTALSLDVRRCAIYTRKSTSAGLEQDFNSLDSQRESCLAYIERQPGWKVVDERYDDGGFTGANIERPAFQRLLADVEARKIDVVVVYKVDRLSRSLLDFAKVIDRFNGSGASFVSVTQNFTTADAMGRLTMNLLASFAEFEREMIAERTRDKIAGARRKGKWTGGPVPLGYDVVEKRLVLNELEAIVVREVFDLYEQHGSILDVANLLNTAGRATKRHRAQNGHLRPGRRWTKDAVSRTLRNPVYAGFMPTGGELHPSEHVAIIDADRWRRIVAALDGKSGPTRAQARNPDYLLRGVLRCGQCGMAMTPASTRKGGREYRYYRCITRDKEGRGACPGRPLSADPIEAFIVERIREATADGRLARDVTKGLDERVAKQRQPLLAERRQLPARIATLSTEGRTLVETLGQAQGTARRLLEERIEDVGAQLGAHEARLSEVERALAEIDRTAVETKWVTNMLVQFDSVWDVMSVENRARLVRALVDRVEVDERNGNVTALLVDLQRRDDGEPEGAERSEACAAEASP